MGKKGRVDRVGWPGSLGRAGQRDRAWDHGPRMAVPLTRVWVRHAVCYSRNTHGALRGSMALTWTPHDVVGGRLTQRPWHCPRTESDYCSMMRWVARVLRCIGPGWLGLPGPLTLWAGPGALAAT